jgi:hypothetical protein
LCYRLHCILGRLCITKPIVNCLTDKPSTNASQEPLLAQLTDLCLHLIKTLLLRCDCLRNSIRILELRAALPVSCLDIAQRTGTDFHDLMSDIHDELCKAIEGEPEFEAVCVTAAVLFGKGRGVPPCC